MILIGLLLLLTLFALTIGAGLGFLAGVGLLIGLVLSYLILRALLTLVVDMLIWCLCAPFRRRRM